MCVTLADVKFPRTLGCNMAPTATIHYPRCVLVTHRGQAVSEVLQAALQLVHPGLVRHGRLGKGVGGGRDAVGEPPDGQQQAST